MSNNPSMPSLSLIPHPSSPLRIGLDLDNTLVFYDDAFSHAARERALVPAHFSGTKQQLRDQIRTLDNGETEWQKLQGHVYGRGIVHASIFPGVSEFITRCRQLGHVLFIVSHKTEFGHYDESKTNLREAALGFLKQHGFFESLGFAPADVSFHATRAEKVSTISSLSLDCFIDDLVEVYEEKHFPKTTRKILFHTSPTPAPGGEWDICSDWPSISKKLFA